MKIPGTTVAVRYYRGRKCIGGHQMNRPFKRSIEITWGTPTTGLMGISKFANVSLILNREGQVYMCGECIK